MADMKKCDRCKQVYTPKAQTLFDELFYGIFNPLRIYEGEKEQRRQNARQFLSNIYDLCPDCEKKLKKWLKKDTDEEAENIEF